MRILIAGGGTGGHLYPGIAVAREFQRVIPGCGIRFVGTREGIESRILPGEGFSLEVLDVAGWVGLGWRKKWGVARRIPRALHDAGALLRRFQPDVVVGVGGYASGPAVLAAAWKGVPAVILEQNALPGMTNRALSYIVDRVVTSFEESRPFFGMKGGVRCLGNSVRPEIFGAR
ncbi:MAG: glycosyltransferase, partial [Nitrospirae bacterium]|nr:glycosyltransferase [Nitrospirota bacterium]